MRNNRLGDAAAQALASSPHLARLDRIELQGNRITPQGRRELAARFGMQVPLF